MTQTVHQPGTPASGTPDDVVPGAEIYTPEFRADPYPVYARLRAERPVVKVRTPRFDSFLVTRYDDARQALSDPRLSKDLYRAGDTYLAVFGEKARQINTNMLNSDPPEHTRLRRLVTQAFTPRRIEGMRPRVEEIVERLLDRMAPKGRTEFVDEFSLRLPLAVIGDLLGIPETDHEEILAGTQVIRTVGTGGRSPQEDRAAIGRAQERLHAYFTGLVAAKRREPGDDLVSALIAARDGDGRLSEAELVSTCFLLLFAGYQTTSDFLGNAVVALLTHPDEMAALLADPDLVPAAVEELLRFDGSVPVSSFRFATEDLEIGGVPIPAGSIVTVVLSAANHDPALVPDPDALDLRRGPTPHMSFGHGIHYCLGTALARLEATTALRRILVRLPDLQLDVPVEELQWLPAASAFRGLLELPLRFTPTPAGRGRAAAVTETPATATPVTAAPVTAERSGRFPLGDRPVARLGFGCMKLTGHRLMGPPADRDAALAVLRRAVELGVEHLETSDHYGPRIVNELVREALHPYPEQLVVVTKVGARRTADGGWIPALQADELRRAVHEDLDTLGMDALHVALLRMPGVGDPQPGSIVEPFEALARLQQEGLVRHIGVSHVTAAQVAEARAIAPLVCVQDHYNLVHRDDDGLIDELATEGTAFESMEGISYTTFFPVRDLAPEQAAVLDTVAQRVGGTRTQVALAWLLARSPNLLVIPGATSVAQLEENVAAAALTLDPLDTAELDRIATIAGAVPPPPSPHAPPTPSAR